MLTDTKKGLGNNGSKDIQQLYTKTEGGTVLKLKTELFDHPESKRRGEFSGIISPGYEMHPETIEKDGPIEFRDDSTKGKYYKPPLPITQQNMEYNDDKLRGILSSNNYDELTRLVNYHPNSVIDYLIKEAESRNFKLKKKETRRIWKIALSPIKEQKDIWEQKQKRIVESYKPLFRYSLEKFVGLLWGSVGTIIFSGSLEKTIQFSEYAERRLAEKFEKRILKKIS